MSEQIPYSGGAADVQVDQHYYQELFEQFKQERREMSEQSGELLFVGELRGDTPAEHWTGNISLKKRLDNGDVTPEELKSAREMLNQCFVPVSEGAPKRCVDGRTRKGYNDNDPSEYRKGLGPQVQGGSEGDVIGSRLAKGYEKGAAYLSDFKKAIETYSGKYAPGGHEGSHADPANGKTDCGQRDGEERRLPNLSNEKLATIDNRLSGVYAGAKLEYPKDKVETLEENAVELDKHKSAYFKDKEKALEYLKEFNPNAAAFLLDNHGEVFVTINFVPDTTFFTDHFNALTNGKIENFNLDAWAIIEEHGEDAFFVLADAVNTLMDLTDGTIELGIRLPKEEPELPQAA